MMSRTQLSLPTEQLRRARARAAEQGISLAEYVRRLVDADLAGLARSGEVSAVFDLGSSRGSDIARRKDEYVGEAVASRLTRRPPSSGRG
jgi:hypothetical protein